MAAKIMQIYHFIGLGFLKVASRKYFTVEKRSSSMNFLKVGCFDCLKNQSKKMPIQILFNALADTNHNGIETREELY